MISDVVSRRVWAVVELDHQLPRPPIMISRWKWYAKWVCWWFSDPDVVVIPWDVPTR